MSFSSYVAQEREKEYKALKTFLIFGITGSVILHLVGFAVVVILSNLWVQKSKLVQEPIPIIVLEPPSRQAVKPKLKEKSLNKIVTANSDHKPNTDRTIKKIVTSETRGGSQGGRPTHTSSVLSSESNPSQEKIAQSQRALISQKPYQPSVSPTTEKPVTKKLPKKIVTNPQLIPKPVATLPIKPAKTSYQEETPPPVLPIEPEEPSTTPRSFPTLPPSQITTPKIPTTAATTLPPKPVETSSSLPTPVAIPTSQPVQTLSRKPVNTPTHSLSTPHLSAPISPSAQQENTHNTTRPSSTSNENGQNTNIATTLGNKVGTGGSGQTNSNLGRGSGNGPKVGTGLGNGSSSTNTLGSDSVVCLRCPAPDPPSGAENSEGRAIVEIDIDSDGSVKDVQIVTSTGHDDLDRSALETIKKKWKFVSSETRQHIRAAVNFTIAGSDFHNLARKRERQAREEQQRRRERVLKP